MEHADFNQAAWRAWSVAATTEARLVFKSSEEQLNLVINALFDDERYWPPEGCFFSANNRTNSTTTNNNNSGSGSDYVRREA